MTLPIAEARRNDEVISLADSQVLRWLDELNGITDADNRAKEIKSEIRRLRMEDNGVKNRRRIKQLYAQLDDIQFKPDYLCVIMDKDKDYRRACRGFYVNGVKYERLLGTNGGVKNKTIVFISERHADEIKRRIDNGRNLENELVPAKLESYKALTCSASIPVSMPHGILVVNDCETEFRADIIYLNDECDGEPMMVARSGELITLDESDGYGLMLPSLAERWSEELGLDYTVSGVNTRFSWEKGMLFTFDFLDFAENVAGGYIVKDAWGNDVDVRDVEVVLTTSMLKLWDSYDSCESYISNCIENRYTFGIAKTCPKELENERTLNYQFIQSYGLDDEDIEELIEPTMSEIRNVLYADWAETVLFLRGAGMSEDNIARSSNDYVKALMVDQRLINDTYVQSSIYQAIRNRINKAKVGCLKVHGNYSIASGDPYSLCQHMFGIEVTGILKAGEIYNKYWCDSRSDALACFRAPMTCHNNIRLVHPNRSEEAVYWYRYMTTCTIFNSWDTSAHALNGMDKDGDLVMLTDNKVLVGKLIESPALMCVQRKAAKKIVAEQDSIQSNIDSFGDDIGKTTNWITSMFDVRAQFEKGSKEYDILDYRIKCGQLYQQNAIDKTKGIVAKPMPREWHDRHRANKIEGAQTRRLYLDIVADKKPYFMRYIYPTLMKQYNTYIKNTNKNAMREFRMTVDEMYDIPECDRSVQQQEFLRRYENHMPVGDHGCVMNKICKRFESEFDGYLGRHSEYDFDYSIMKSGAEYTNSQYNAILKLYDAYNRRLKNFVVFSRYERVDENDAYYRLSELRDEFDKECALKCPNRQTLCDIILDICYQRNSTKRFAWEMCGDIIVQNLLRRNGWMIRFPVLDQDGDIQFCGDRFSVKEMCLEGCCEPDYE